jgi:hypothetical protein
MIKSGIMKLFILIEAFGGVLRRGAPWRSRLARDLQQVFVKGKGGPAVALYSTGIYYKIINFLL